MPAYKNKVWDGKIRLFSIATGRIYVGLLGYLKRFCDRNDIEINIEEGVEDVKEIGRQVVEGFVKSLKPKSKGKSIKLRDYQIDAIEYALKSHRLFLFLLLLQVNR